MKDAMKLAALGLALALNTQTASASMDDIELSRGTMLCESDKAMEYQLERRDNGKMKETAQCKRLERSRDAKIEKRYPVKGYVRVGIDGRQRYVAKDAVKR